MCSVDRTFFILRQFSVVKPYGFIAACMYLANNDTSDVLGFTRGGDMIDGKRCLQRPINTTAEFLGF